VARLERSDEAIHSAASGKMDCFASLAMTTWRDWSLEIPGSR
jgi:hypothetical protein